MIILPTFRGFYKPASVTAVVGPTTSSNITASSQYRIYGSNANYTTAKDTASGTDNGLFQVGQYYSGGTYAVYRDYLKFNTSIIGESKTITEVKMVLTPSDKSSVGTNFNVVISDYNWSATDPLTSGNMETAYDGCAAAATDNTFANTSVLTLNVPYTGSILSTSWINKSGFTYYGLQSDRTISSTTPTGFELILFYQPSDTAAYRPKLIVTYY